MGELLRDGVRALTLKFRENHAQKNLPAKKHFERQNENVVEIGIREAKSKTFFHTFVIHKKDEAMSKNRLNQHSRLIVADLPYVNFKAN